MGFFQDLKEDLSQAVTEMMDDDSLDTTEEVNEEIPETEETTEAEEFSDEVSQEEYETDSIGENVQPQEMSLEVMVDAIAAQPLDEAAEENVEMPEVTEPAQEEKSVETISEDSIQEAIEDDTEELMKSVMEEMRAVKEKHAKAEKTMSNEFNNEEPIDETAIITQGMEIIGNVKSKGSLDIIGSIEGDIDILGKLNITGSVKGNSKAAEVFADAAKIIGEVHTAGTVKIGASSVIIGNITATSAVIAGAVKGDIDVQGAVILDTSAIVMGNIKSKSVQINNGAVIEGLCSQCYADVNPINFFDEFK